MKYDKKQICSNGNWHVGSCNRVMDEEEIKKEPQSETSHTTASEELNAL